METKKSGWVPKKALTIVTIAIFLLGFEIYAIAIVHVEDKVDLPKQYGNFQANRDALEQQAPKEQFSFAVVGDIEESETFEVLCDKLRDEPLSFMVMLGDFVKRCGKQNHAYFRSQCAEKYRLPFPVFLVAGNREVAYKEIDQDIGDVSFIDFEDMYGALNSSFEYNNCLFIGLCILPPPYSTGNSIEFLESTLAEKRKDNQKVFVFMHVSPVLKPDYVTPCCENVHELVDIFSKNKVDYVISAHYHSYRRTERADTIYLVSGGGGGELDDTKVFDGLHHAVVLTVDCASVSENIIFVKRKVDVLGEVKRFAITKFYPFFVRHPVLTIVENLVLICAVYFITLSTKKKTHIL